MIIFFFYFIYHVTNHNHQYKFPSSNSLELYDKYDKLFSKEYHKRNNDKAKEKKKQANDGKFFLQVFTLYFTVLCMINIYFRSIRFTFAR